MVHALLIMKRTEAEIFLDFISRQWQSSNCLYCFQFLTGLLTRSLSTRVNDTASVIGPNGHCNVSRTNQLLAFSPINVSSNLLAESKNSTTGMSAASLVPVDLALSDSELSLEQALTRLTLSPLESRLTVDRLLPSAEMSVRERMILDPSPFASLLRDCPAVIPHPSFHDPVTNQPPPGIWLPVREGTTMEKRASNIMQKRRRKMNRHQYLKWKKRNKFKLRIHKQKSRKKKRLRWEQHLSKFRFAGLKPGEGEDYLAKKRASQAIYLRYLGIDIDEETEGGRKKKQEVQPVGAIVPERVLPPGASMWALHHKIYWKSYFIGGKKRTV